MSAGKKLVQFEAADKAKGKSNKIPTDVAPDEVALAGGADGAERTMAEFAALPLRDRTAVDEQFPTDEFTSTSKKDIEMAEKLELQGAAVGKAPGVTPFGILTASDEDFKWLDRKREKEAEANFQQWFATNFDHMSVEQKKWAREMWPEFYEQRLQLLDKELDLYRDVARIGVTGIQNKRDLMLQYAKESGYIDMERLMSLAHPQRYAEFQNKQERESRFVRGLWNPKRLPRKVDHSGTREAHARGANLRAVAPFAASLGIGSNGFNAQGVLNDKDERRSHFGDLLSGVLDPSRQLPNPAAAVAGQ